jgi:hypothetical protein
MAGVVRPIVTALTDITVVTTPVEVVGPLNLAEGLDASTFSRWADP